MNASSLLPLFPGIVTARFFETWDFYTSVLGFRTFDEDNVSVHLVHPDGARLSLLRHEIDGPHAELISATEGRGFWLNLEVSDFEAAYARLVDAGVHVESTPEVTRQGRQRTVIRDPNGILIYLVDALRVDETVLV